MTTDFDAYAILGTHPGATQGEIDEAYRRARDAYDGPDRASDHNPVEIAYRLLASESERRAYDERRGAAFPAPVAAEAAAAAGVEPPPPVGKAPWGLLDIFLGVIVALGVGLIGSIPFLLASIEIAGGSSKVDNDPNALAVQLIGGSLLEFAFVLAVWLFAVRKYKVNWSAIGFRRPQRGSWWLGFVMFLAAMAIVIAFGLILSALDQSPDTDLPGLAYRNVFPALILVILTVVLAPLMEEIFFRGFAYQGFARRWGIVAGITASGILFGSAHFLNPGGLYVAWPIMLIGALFAWGVYYSKSILPSIAAHFLFNGVQIAGGLISPPDDDDSEATIHLARMLAHLAENGLSILQ